MFSASVFNMVSVFVFMLSASVLISFLHYVQIIFASVFVSLENVISETPTREINGFAFWNVVRNMIYLSPQPSLKSSIARSILNPVDP